MPFARIAPDAAATSERFVMLLTPTTTTGWADRAGAAVTDDTADGIALTITRADGTTIDVRLNLTGSGPTPAVTPITLDGAALAGRVEVTHRDTGGTATRAFTHGAP
jgi:hypothetical protein